MYATSCRSSVAVSRRFPNGPRGVPSISSRVIVSGKSGAGQQTPLFTAEVAYDGQAFPTPDAWLHIKAADQHRLWQKERLLNLLTQELADGFL